MTKTVDDFILRGYREGIEIEKGVVISEQHAVENEELYKKYCNLFTAYPDLFKRAAYLMGE